jgi:predicted unusual protein kinase regulating ubiquinone biosynthesis (AarF/ABC1/UbiB family)
MIKVHCAETLLNERVVIKVLYPEIRQYMAADLANLKQAVLMISKLLSMAMKDAIEAVSTELCDNFPRELDFRIEQAFTERARYIYIYLYVRVVFRQYFEFFWCLFAHTCQLSPFPSYF